MLRRLILMRLLLMEIRMLVFVGGVDCSWCRRITNLGRGHFKRHVDLLHLTQRFLATWNGHSRKPSLTNNIKQLLFKIENQPFDRSWTAEVECTCKSNEDCQMLLMIDTQAIFREEKESSHLRISESRSLNRLTKFWNAKSIKQSINQNPWRPDTSAVMVAHRRL